MIPRLVTPPAAPPVSLAEVKTRLFVDGTDKDSDIESMIEEAVSMLDGWHGILGRAIMEQTWQVTVTGPGPHLLPMPDVTAVSVLVDGTAIPEGDVKLMPTAAGSLVDFPRQSGEVAIEFTCALPDHRLPHAKAIIKSLVGHWLATPEGVVVGTITSEVPLSAAALIASLRWVRV